MQKVNPSEPNEQSIAKHGAYHGQLHDLFMLIILVGDRADQRFGHTRDQRQNGQKHSDRLYLVGDMVKREQESVTKHTGQRAEHQKIVDTKHDRTHLQIIN